MTATVGYPTQPRTDATAWRASFAAPGVHDPVVPHEPVRSVSLDTAIIAPPPEVVRAAAVSLAAATGATPQTLRDALIVVGILAPT